ncbi:MAG: peptide-methionine (S)-S-oxide reductase MsrA [Tissierellia bacterium]|nr:peptide-methionine (S)-S-oxide reductase MsrA [Tissierellia bacterium]
MHKKLIAIIIIGLIAIFALIKLNSKPQENKLENNENNEVMEDKLDMQKEILNEVKTDEKTLYLAGGCFWGMEAYFANVPGVIDAKSGYANSNTENPSYEEVCTGKTDAAETVKLVYNPHIVSMEELIIRYFKVIDPFSLNKQGGDVGTQYRTGIYYTDENLEKKTIEKVVAFVEKKLGKKTVVEIEPLKNFYDAEDYHQDYLEKNPGGYCHINLNEVYDSVLDYKEYEKESDEELKSRIGAEAFDIARNSGTERPGTGEYNDFDEKGLYVDIVSGKPLFTSEKKFDAGCGWPSFSAPLTTDSLDYIEDNSHGMKRVEVKSKDDTHLGHVFNDGPKEMGGLRYCINSASLKFIPYDKLDEEGYGEYKVFFEE